MRTYRFDVDLTIKRVVSYRVEADDMAEAVKQVEMAMKPVEEYGSAQDAAHTSLEESEIVDEEVTFGGFVFWEATGPTGKPRWNKAIRAPKGATRAKPPEITSAVLNGIGACLDALAELAENDDGGGYSVELTPPVNGVYRTCGDYSRFMANGEYRAASDWWMAACDYLAVQKTTDDRRRRDGQ